MGAIKKATGKKPVAFFFIYLDKRKPFNVNYNPDFVPGSD
jgi:hypothetical protein